MSKFSVKNQKKLNNAENDSKILCKLDNYNIYNGRMSLFFNTTRGLNIPMFYNYLINSAKENIIDTFLLIFYIRDCRGGKGERELGRYGFIWLFLNYPSYFHKIMKFLPEYGRWDDIIEIWPKKLELTNINFIRKNYYINDNYKLDIKYLQKIQNESILLIGKQLISDKTNMLKGKPISLCAKWCPTENCSLDIKYSSTKILCKKMGWSLKKYRKEFITPLRKYLKIVEIFMCNYNWEKIDFNKVPICCMKKLKNAFEKKYP